MTTVDVLRRRYKVFEYWGGRNLSPKAISELLAQQGIKASLRIVQMDIKSMEEWLPMIVNIKGDGEVAAAEILGILRLIRQRAINLGDTASNPSAQVGALKAATDATVKEMELRLRTGQIRTVPEKVEVTNTHELAPLSDDKIARYIDTAVAVALEEEARGAGAEDDCEDPGEPVDPKPPPPGD